MLSNQKFLKIMVSTLMALLSAAWILPFSAAAHFILDLLKKEERHLVNKLFPDSYNFSYIELSEWFLVIAEILLAIVILFWSFVATWKLMPPKKKNTLA